MTHPDQDLQQKLLPWKILIADDDADVHTATLLALRGITFRGRKLEFINVYSGAEALRALEENPDIAVAFLDVIMETDRAGLGAVQKIREQGHRLVRLIVRTGHPGQAPEREVIVNYDIHDYKEKAGITAQKLFTCLISALRAYDDLVALENHRRGLMGVLESISWFDFDDVQRYVAGMLLEFSALAHLRSEQIVILSRLYDDEVPRVVAVSGEWEAPFDSEFPPFLSLPQPVMDLVNESFAGQKACVADSASTLRVAGHGVELVAYVGGHEAFAGADIVLLEVFLLKVCQAVANQQSFQSVSQERDALLHGLGVFAERWDPQGADHLERVAKLSQRLAKRLETTMVFGEQIDDRFVRNVEEAARLHDLGNLALPPELLQKPGPLSVDETALMRTHVALGLAQLAPLRAQAGRHGGIALAAEVIAAHHECYDGSGYPDGLAGEAIPLAARVVAVADAWASMTANRPYRLARSPTAARDEIVAQAGRQFDPRVVEAFLQVIENETVA